MQAGLLDAPSVSVAVRYSRGGREQLWCHTLPLDTCDDGPADAARLRRAFAAAAAAGCGPGQCGASRGSGGGGSSSSSNGSGGGLGGGGAGAGPDCRRGACGARLRVVPCHPGGPQKEVSPVQGQSLVDFLEKACREDSGIFQLRAVFDAPAGDGLHHVCVAFPGAARLGDVAAGAGGPDAPDAPVEQFELAASSCVADLKKMIQARTQFPANRGVLLLGQMRLHDEVPMVRVASAAGAAARAGGDAALRFHLASGGAYAFLRREGQGHREPAGPCALTLRLPSFVQGAQVRPMKFDPERPLGDLRWSIQAVSGLPPAGMQLSLAAPVSRSFTSADGGEALESLGFTDGCTLKVQFDMTEQSHMADAFDMPLETPTSGGAAALYETAAAKLGVADPAALVLFAGGTAITRCADLSHAPLADGTVLSAYIAWSLQLSVSVLPTRRGGAAAAPPDDAGPPGAGGEAPPGGLQPLACLSSDTIAEVRERAIGAAATARSDLAARLRGSKVFAVGLSVWAAAAAEMNSLAKLAQLLGHFAPCGDTARLSRLGIAEGVHLVFVPDPQLLVEIEVRISGERSVVRKLRVAATTRLVELSRLLEQDLRAQPIADRPPIEHVCCLWSLPRSCRSGAPFAQAPSSSADPGGLRAPGRPMPPARPGAGLPRPGAPAAAAGASPARGASGVAALVESAAAVVAKGKRRLSGSFGGRREQDNSGVKRMRLDEVSDEMFVGDLHAQHPAGPQEMPRHFLCPISYDVMRDPVVVSGSGNTYDRKSIEHAFQQRHSDPLTNVELRRAADRRLVPNNWLRSQINEAERAQVDLRLVAALDDRRRTCAKPLSAGDGHATSSGDGPMSPLRWCSSFWSSTYGQKEV